MAFLTWLAAFVAEGHTGRPSVKRFGFALAVTVLALVMGLFGGVMCAVAWMGHAGPHAVDLLRIVSGSLEVLAGLVLTAVTTGYVAGKAVERPRNESQSGDGAEKP